MAICPYCGAEFEIPQGVPIATCPYCGTSIKVETGEHFKEHYLFRVNYDYNAAYEKLLAVVSREVGSPKDLSTSSAPTGGTLYFIPLYVFHIDLKAMHGRGKVSEEVEDVATLASKDVPVPIPEGYKFPVRGRLYFDPKVVKGGKYLSPLIDPEKALQLVESPFRDKVMKEALLETGSKLIKIESHSEFIGLAHYPFWEVKYSYKGEEYRGYIDACDGTVVYAEYPKSLEVRVLASTLALLASSLLGGLLTAMLGLRVSPLEGLIGGLLTSLPALIITLRRGIGERGLYELKVEEIGITEEIR